jgi:hypothetical protein
MPVQRENRGGKERRNVDMSSVLPREIERRWNKDQRRAVVDEEELLDPDREASDADLEPSGDDSVRD